MRLLAGEDLDLDGLARLDENRTIDCVDARGPGWVLVIFMI